MVLLPAFIPNLVDPIRQIAVVLSYGQGYLDIAFIPNSRAVNADPDAEGAVILPVCPEGGFAKDQAQSVSDDFIAITGFGIEGLFLGLPVLFLGGLELPAILGVADKLRIVEFLDGCLDLGDRCRVADLIDQEGGNVRLRSRQVADEFQKTNGLGNPKRPLFVRVALESLADFVNVCAALVRQVAFNKLVHAIQRHQGANRTIGEPRPIGYKHLVSLLDDRPVASSEVPGRSGLKPNSRHDADADVDVMRWVRIELDEIIFTDSRST